MFDAPSFEDYSDEALQLKKLHFGARAAKLPVGELEYPSWQEIQASNATRANAQAMQRPGYTPKLVDQLPPRFRYATPPGQSPTLPGVAIPKASAPTAEPRSALPPPADAVNMLQANPALAPLFDEKYGQGTAAAYLK